MRTSSATNVGADKDSEKRQRVVIEAFAKRAGLEIVEWFYDPAVSGADPPRPKFLHARRAHRAQVAGRLGQDHSRAGVSSEGRCGPDAHGGA
jgi:hypothetical protein